jgi:hypothetical protein
MLGLFGGLAVSGGGCGLTEMNIGLAQQQFTYDLSMTPQFNLPSVACQSASTCQQLLQEAGIIDTRVTGICDMSTSLCAADVNLTIIYIYNVATDPAFETGIAQSDASAVRTMTLNYTINNNTNFNINNIAVYIGPNGIMSSTAPGVEPIGNIGPVPSNGILTQNQQPLVIMDGTPAHDQVVMNIENPQDPFNFLMVSTIEIPAGAPVPHGQVLVQVQPVVELLK